MLRIEKLTVNHLFEAVGMDEAPRFSWRTLADGRGFVQQRYRLQIARNIGFCEIKFLYLIQQNETQIAA